MTTALTTIADRAATTPADYLAARGETHRFLDLTRAADRSLVQGKIAAMMRIEQLVRVGMTRQRAIADVGGELAHKRGFSRGKLTKDFQLWSKGGQKQDAQGRRSGQYYHPRDWRMFVPAYTNGDQQAALANKPFIEHIRQMDADSVRDDVKGMAVRERLLKAWYEGHAIPGFGTIYQHCAERGLPVPDPRDMHRNLPAFLPAGWSADNINRIIGKFEAQRAYTRRGEHAAHSHWGDQLLRDRSKLMPLQLVTFDDVHFDIAVIWDVPGQKSQIVRPHAIFALDVATGVILSYGVLGAYTRDSDKDGGKAGTKRNLQQADMRYLVCNLMERYGMPRDWQMSFLVENASASIGAVDEQIFCELTGARIERTGLIRNKLFKSDFVEQGGMPWQKGWIESWFRLFHMRTNHLPGATGPNYNIVRGGLKKAADYSVKVATAALDKGIPLDQIDLPLLTLSQFEELVAEYVMRLNMRTNHSLQGFERAYEIETTPGVYYRTDDPRALPYLKDGADIHARMESPVERLLRLARGHRFEPVHPRVLATLALDKHAVTLGGDKIRLGNKRLGDGKLEYFDADAVPALRRHRGKDTIVFTTTDGALAHVFTDDADLTFIATLRCNERADMLDEHAILARAAEVHRNRQSVRDNVADLLAPRNERFAAMREQHEALGLVEPHRVADRIDKETTRVARKKAEEREADSIEHDYFDQAANIEQQYTGDDDDIGLNPDILTNL